MKVKPFNKSVSVVIPTFNGKQLLQKFLPSILQSLRNLDELIIVDDASSDKTAAWLKQKFKLNQSKSQSVLWQGVYKTSSKRIQIKLLVLPENCRFAQAANRGVDQAKHRYVGLFNNDVKLQRDTITNLVRWFNDPDVFAVGCLEFEGADKLAQRSGKNSLWFERGLFVHARANNFATGQTAWASGGSSMFDKHKWQQLNGFDLNYYPAYWEDIDLSTRAKKKGWKIWFDSESIVFHQHESTNALVFSSLEATKNSWQHADYFTWKHADVWQRISFLLWRPYWWWQRRRSSQPYEESLQ